MSDTRGSRFDTLYGLLADSRERYTLYFLLESKQTTIDQLAVQVTAWERDVSVDTISLDGAEDVVISLTHNQLPRLADRGFIEYDPRHGDVVATEKLESARETVEKARAFEAAGERAHSWTESSG